MEEDVRVSQTESPPSVPDKSDERRRRSLNTTSRDMVLSMAVIVGIVVLLLLLVPRPNQIPTRTLDVESAAQGARSQLGFPPAVPADLPAGWTPRAASVQLGTTDGLATWHLTYTTPSGRYAGVQQTENATAAWEARQVTDGRVQGTRRIGSRNWIVRSRVDRGVTSLVLRQPGRVPITTIVTGTATASEIDQFARAVIP
jgi:Protein of unknown function (DUF4245)